MKRVFVCYVPGLDSRRLSPETTPAICDLIERYPSIEVTGLPGTDLAPVLLSGTAPHQNRLWQVSLKERRERTAGEKLVDMLPDLVTTTAQCVRQFFDTNYDLSALPPRRRRRFNLHRLSEAMRAADPELLEDIGGFETLTGRLGGAYRFTLGFDKLDEFEEQLPDFSVRFDFLQNHAFDIKQHWYIDDPAALKDALARTDKFVGRMAEKCAASGHTMVLLSDHGQDPVTGTVPLVQTLRNSGVPEDEYTYYCELPTARLWFHTDRARDTIKPLVEALPNSQLVHYTDMHQYDVRFEDDSYGEYYVICEPGSIFFRTTSGIRSPTYTWRCSSRRSGAACSTRSIAATTDTCRTTRPRRASWSSWITPSGRTANR